MPKTLCKSKGEMNNSLVMLNNIINQKYLKNNNLLAKKK